MELESKLLDGPRAGYCSSSEEEDDCGFKVVNDEDEHQANVMRRFGGGSNTGPKGVLDDFKAHREQQNMEKMARMEAIRKEAERGMFQSKKEDREKAQMEEDEEEDDDDLTALRKRRIAEMRKAAAGRMLEIQDKDQFLKTTDGAVDGLLAVLLYEPDREDCEKMTHLCKLLAATYPKVKFARVRASILEMSTNYVAKALPTLQFYSNGSLIGNFLRVTDEIGLDCSAQKMKNNISLNLNCFGSDVDTSSGDE